MLNKNIETSVIAKLLGETNEQKIKDEITNILIEAIREDVEDIYSCIIDWELLFDEINRELHQIVKEKFVKKYLEEAEKKWSELYEQNKGV